MHDVNIFTETGRQIVHNVSCRLEKGQCLGIVGESGSGKTLLCMALLGLLPPNLRTEGQIFFEGKNLLAANADETRKLRGTAMGCILQHAMTAFDPLYTLGSQFTETLSEKLHISASSAEKRAAASLRKVNLPESETSQAVEITGINVTVDKKGNMQFNGEIVTLAKLPAKLEAFPAGDRKREDIPVTLEADEDVKNGMIVKLFDALRKSGYVSVSLRTKS